jgi:hypothetical protein
MQPAQSAFFVKLNLFYSCACFAFISVRTVSSVLAIFSVFALNVSERSPGFAVIARNLKLSVFYLEDRSYTVFSVSTVLTGISLRSFCAGIALVTLFALDSGCFHVRNNSVDNPVSFLVYFDFGTLSVFPLYKREKFFKASFKALRLRFIISEKKNFYLFFLYPGTSGTPAVPLFSFPSPPFTAGNEREAEQKH